MRVADLRDRDMNRFGLAALALVAMSGGALAFEQQGGDPGTAQPPAAAAPPAAGDLKGLNLQTPDMPAKKSGTEIRVPGLGVIGTIPKVEFGLDLLYGANESKGPDAEKAEPGELTVRGKVRF